MANFKERMEAEFENIQRILSRLPESNLLPNLSDLELAGVAALIHSFYNGVENILKQAVYEKGKDIPQGQTWHRDLVELTVKEGIISPQTSKAIAQYLAFRHFFSHAYAFDLHPERIVPLVKGAKDVLENLRVDVEK